MWFDFVVKGQDMLLLLTDIGEKNIFILKKHKYKNCACGVIFQSILPKRIGIPVCCYINDSIWENKLI